MRYPSDHKPRTRQRILDAAARLFRRHGYRGVGIDRIMTSADLTRGAFYAHFPSKEALFGAVVGQESDFVRRLRAAEDGRDVVRAYLDPANREKIARGCTLATLTQDVPRTGSAPRAAYARLVARLAGALEAHVPADAPDRRGRALAAMALAVGAIGLARGVGDEALAREILAACSERACAELGGGAPTPS